MTIQTDAQTALDKSDTTVLRCYDSGVQLPQEWASYRATLREIVSGSNLGPLPTQPEYPVGS